MPTHKTSAWPLALVYAGLIVYASLYPFASGEIKALPLGTFAGTPAALLDQV